MLLALPDMVGIVLLARHSFLSLHWLSGYLGLAIFQLVILPCCQLPFIAISAAVEALLSFLLSANQRPVYWFIQKIFGCTHYSCCYVILFTNHWSSLWSRDTPSPSSIVWFLIWWRSLITCAFCILLRISQWLVYLDHMFVSDHVCLLYNTCVVNTGWVLSCRSQRNYSIWCSVFELWLLLLCGPCFIKLSFVLISYYPRYICPWYKLRPGI